MDRDNATDSTTVAPSSRARTPEQLADAAMGLELIAIDFEDRLEWAEVQGRSLDASRLAFQHRAVLDELADLIEASPRAA